MTLAITVSILVRVYSANEYYKNHFDKINNIERGE